MLAVLAGQELLSQFPIRTGVGFALLCFGTSDAALNVAANTVLMMLFVCLVILGTDGLREM